MPDRSTNEVSVESRVRRLARREGYVVLKSRRQWSLENRGEYMLLDASTNFPVCGWHYDASLDEIEEYLRD